MTKFYVYFRVVGRLIVGASVSACGSNYTGSRQNVRLADNPRKRLRSPAACDSFSTSWSPHFRLGDNF